MKDFSIEFKVPNIFVKIDDRSLLVPSMVLSTLSVLVLSTLLPQLMPMWMAIATGSRV